MTASSLPASPLPAALGAEQARGRLHELTVVDVRTPGEYASGHLPGAVNVPLDQVRRALPDIRAAVARGGLLVVCASGARSEAAHKLLAEQGIPSATLTGGTGAWAAAGYQLHRPEQEPPCRTRAAWGMERQVRFTAGTLVLLGLLLGVLVHPAFQFVSAAVAGGLVLSALTDTCGMALVLARLPHNRPRPADLEAALAALRGR